ncbi:MAG: hypothetical protein AAFX93_06395 [Verrucomicrobiota bacterium]
MKRHTLSSLIIFLSGFLLVEAATITGQVDTSELPSQKRSSSRYNRGATEQPSPPPSPRAVVYLEGEFAPEIWDAAPKNGQLIQKGLQFKVSVLPITKGTMVVFPNEDNTFHNVFSYSPEKTFDLGRYRKGEDPGTQVFDKPGEIEVFCEIHRHMRSTILVLDSPIFTTADESGNFTLNDIPAGDYELVVWYAPGKTSRQPINVPAGESDLTVDLAKPTKN